MRDDERTGGSRAAGLPEGVAAGRPPVVEFCVDVRSETLRTALIHVGTSAGFAACRTVGAGTCSVVDEASVAIGSPASNPRVLVVDPSPYGAHHGVRALAAGLVSAIVSDQRPTDFARALEMLSAGHALTPLDVIEAAARMPALSERQTAIMGAILAGQSTVDIAKGLYLSVASVKRELATLFRSFGVENRLELAAFAASLGLKPMKICP